MEEYLWSSYREYAKNSNEIVDKKQIFMLFGKNKKEAIENLIQFHKVNEKANGIKEMIEYEMTGRISDEQAKKYIEEILKIKNIQEIIQYDKVVRNEHLRKLKNVQGISKAQIARVIGISEKIVERAMK